MNSQEAITLLRNLEDALDSYCELNEEGKTAFRMAITALSCSEIPNGWIPVSKDTNPSKSGWYIVTCPEEMTASDERFSSIAEYDATTGEWFDMDEPTDCYLAWMPLPEPYRPKED